MRIKTFNFLNNEFGIQAYSQDFCRIFILNKKTGTSIYNFRIEFESLDVSSSGMIGTGWTAIAQLIKLNIEELKTILQDIEKKSNLFYINGYWKDDKSEFQRQLIYSFHGNFNYQFESDGAIVNQDDVFHFGLSEADIKKEIAQPSEALDFGITSYEPFQ